MARRKKWSFLLILIPIIAVGIFFFLSIHYVIDPDLYRNVIQKSLTLALGREVTVGKARITLSAGVGVAFEDFRIKDRSLSFDLLQSKRLILNAKIFPLLRKEVKWKRIILERPILQVHRDKNGRFNIFDGLLTPEGLKASQQKIVQTLATLFGGSFTLRGGEISFLDESLGDSPLTTKIRSFNLQIPEVSYQKPFPFRLGGKTVYPEGEGQFSIAGTIRNIPEDMDFSKGRVEAELDLNGIEILHFWPYLKTFLPMKTISGILDLKAHYQGDFSGALKTSAKIKFRNLVYDHPQVFSYVLNPKWVDLDLDVEYDLKDIRVSRLSIKLPEIWVKAKGRIYAVGSNEMGMEAEAQSGLFDLSDGKKFIPYRIITKDVSDPLFRSEGSGPVQILSVKLSGRMPEIDHCDQLQNARTLSVEMKADKVRLKFPWDLPSLEDFKGHLLFKDGHLNVEGAEGRVLHSTIDHANGIFYQFLLIPTLQLNGEGRVDLADLLSLMKSGVPSNDLSRTLSPITSISGRANYRISVKGELKPPLHFQHQGVYSLSKVRFTHPQFPFPVLIGEGKVDLSNEHLQWSRAAVMFGNSSLLTDGSWKRDEKLRPFEMVAKGRVDLKNLFALSQSPLFPEEVRLKAKGIESLSGVGQILFKGQRLATPYPFSYEGELIPREVQLLPKGVSAPLIFREGILSFSNVGLSFSKVKIQSGNSILTVDGSVKQEALNLSTSGTIDLGELHGLLPSPLFSDQVRSEMQGIQQINGQAEVRLRWLGKVGEWTKALKEGEVRLRGISFRHEKIPVPLSQVEGSLLLSPTQVQIDGLKGRLGDSPITLSGALSRISPSYPSAAPPGDGTDSHSAGSGRWLSLEISSSQLDLDPIFPKRKETSPTSFEKVRNWLSNWSIECKVNADQGSYRGFRYRDLKVGMKSTDGKLLLHPFQFEGDGGNLWGEGWIQPSERGINFEIKPRLSNMDAKGFLRALFQKGEGQKVTVTGRIHIDKVELRGEGEDFQRAKESLNGRLRLQLENGVIERFNLLAKIFSILNVSQLFRGRLPDLAHKGLPYHQIMANIHIKDGIASTDDFVVDSDAMKITILGNVDLGKNLIDARIGIHPLVTLDTVLSHVPIAGYILTGDNKAFLSYVYEIKGNLDDPKIEAIPIKSMEEGFLGVIKRLLETPLRPFQKSPSSK